MQVVIKQEGGHLTDTVAAYPEKYQYRVLAYDQSGLVSSSDISYIRPFDSGQRGTITNLTADSTGIDAEADFGTNELTWEYDALNGLYDFQIYRSVDGKPMRAYATTNGRGGVNFAEEVASGGLLQVAAGGFAWKDPEVGNARVLAQSGFPAAVPGSPLKRTFRYQIQARHFDGGWSPLSAVVEIELWVPGE